MAGEFKNDTFQNEVREILKKYKVSYDAAAQSLIQDILRRINAGVSVSKAVDDALKATDFQGTYEKAVIDAVYLAACAGFGVLPGQITANSASVIKQKLLSDSWAADKMPLSHRLHTLDVRGRVVQVIRSSMQKMQSIKAMAINLYDGYNSGSKVLDATELSDKLSEMCDLGIRAAQGDRALVAEIRKKARQLQRAVNGLQTKSLQAAYNDFLQACCSEDLKEEVIEHAAHVAVQERTRYLAERIARTEAARAWFDGCIAERQDNPEIWGYRWKLSSRHPFYDQCDVCAHMDVGYGPGAYPKGKVPSIPRHPHCMCMLEDVFSWEKSGSKIQPDKAREYIDSLRHSEKTQLFGADGLEKYEAGHDWQQLLKGWDGFSHQKSRLDKNDFLLKDSLSNDIITSKGGSSLETLEQARKKDHLFEITDVAIKHIPIIKVPNFSDEQNLALQATHKSLLQAAKNENNGKEVLFIQQQYFSDPPIKIYGTENSVNYGTNVETMVLKNKSYANELIISHNHPSTKGFSFADIAVFIIDEYIATSTVVSNQGQIYLLHKCNHFEYNKARKLLNALDDKYELSKYPADEERQILAARAFLKQAGKVGVWYEKSNK